MKKKLYKFINKNYSFLHLSIYMYFFFSSKKLHGWSPFSFFSPQSLIPFCLQRLSLEGYLIFCVIMHYYNVYFYFLHYVILQLMLNNLNSSPHLRSTLTNDKTNEFLKFRTIHHLPHFILLKTLKFAFFFCWKFFKF
jgi:hypothetical protein